MCKFKNFILTAILLVISARTMRANDPCDIYRHEAESFLSAMPKDLQRRQAEAIRQAIAGNNRLLEGIRASRNRPPELPSVVTRTPVGDNMVLFRDRRYENDTIPLLLYFHGGGWTIGSINSCSRFCSEMALNGSPPNTHIPPACMIVFQLLKLRRTVLNDGNAMASLWEETVQAETLR